VRTISRKGSLSLTFPNRSGTS
jgi:hypothetical protein